MAGEILPQMDQFLVAFVLWLHLFFAIIFIGGSFFIWMVVWPSSFDLTQDEKYRTSIVGTMSKRFALFTNVSVLILISTGLFLAYSIMSSSHGFLGTIGGELLIAKVVAVALAIGIMYYNNLGHTKKIKKMIEEGKMNEVSILRKRAHFLSFVTLGLLVVVTILAAAMQIF